MMTAPPKLRWVAWCERQWAGVLGLFTFLLVSLANSLMEISSGVIFLIVPIPNAVNVYHISSTFLNFNPAASWAFALTTELALFAAIEKALRHFEGWNRNRRKYRWTFVTIVVSTVLVSLLLSILVYWIENRRENGDRIMAALPFLSLLLFIIVGLDRWHERQPESMTRGTQITGRVPLQLPQNIPLTAPQSLPQNVGREAESPQGEPQSTENEPQSTENEPPISGENFAEGTISMEQRVLNFLAEHPNSKVLDVARALGVSKPTVAKHLNFLELNGMVNVQAAQQTYFYSLSEGWQNELVQS